MFSVIFGISSYFIVKKRGVSAKEVINFSIKTSLNYDSIFDGELIVSWFLIKNSFFDKVRRLVFRNVNCNFDFYRNLEFNNQISNDSNVLSKKNKISFE